MKLSDVTKRLNNPFPAHLIVWKFSKLSDDRARALLTPSYPARAVMDRLDAICPDLWSFAAEAIPSAPVASMRGALTVLGVTRMDVGTDEAHGRHPGASEDALKRCAVLFGIGRYFHDLPEFWVDWDEAKQQPVQRPSLPDWALPDHERTPGGAHLIQALDQLKIEMPADLSRQRDVYRHLKDALSSLHPHPRPE